MKVRVCSGCDYLSSDLGPHHDPKSPEPCCLDCVEVSGGEPSQSRLNMRMVAMTRDHQARRKRRAELSREFKAGVMKHG